MAARWGSWRVTSSRISSWFLSARIGLNGANIFKPCLNQCTNSFARLQTKTQLIQQASFFHMQYRHPAVQCCKLPWSSILQQSLYQRIKIASIHAPGGISVAFKNPLLSGHVCSGVLCRGITMVSKKGKRKTCKAVAKRFIRTGKGKLKRWRCGKHHNQSKKSNRRKRFLRKPTYVSKTQLKTLNKMLNGW